PQYPVGEALDKHAHEGDGIAKGRALAGDALAAADLHPEALVFKQVEQHLECRLVEAPARGDATHVVDDHGDRQAPQHWRQRLQPVGIEMDNGMPAEGPNLFHDRPYRVEIGVAAQMRNEIEAHAANAAPFEFYDLGFGNIGGNHRNA